MEQQEQQKWYRVYLQEVVEYSYDVKARTEAEARTKIEQGDYDYGTYNVIDSYNQEITGILEWGDD